MIDLSATAKAMRHSIESQRPRSVTLDETQALAIADLIERLEQNPPPTPEEWEEVCRDLEIATSELRNVIEANARQAATIVRLQKEAAESREAAADHVGALRDEILRLKEALDAPPASGRYERIITAFAIPGASPPWRRDTDKAYHLTKHLDEIRSLVLQSRVVRMVTSYQMRPAFDRDEYLCEWTTVVEYAS